MLIASVQVSGIANSCTSEVVPQLRVGQRGKMRLVFPKATRDYLRSLRRAGVRSRAGRSRGMTRRLGAAATTKEEAIRQVGQLLVEAGYEKGFWFVFELSTGSPMTSANSTASGISSSAVGSRSTASQLDAASPNQPAA